MCKEYPGTDVNSNYNPVIVKLKFQLENIQKTSTNRYIIQDTRKKLDATKNDDTHIIDIMWKMLTIQYTI